MGKFPIPLPMPEVPLGTESGRNETLHQKPVCRLYIRFIQQELAARGEFPQPLQLILLTKVEAVDRTLLQIGKRQRFPLTVDADRKLRIPIDETDGTLVG